MYEYIRHRIICYLMQHHLRLCIYTSHTYELDKLIKIIYIFPSQEVLLKFVQRLASLQNFPQNRHFESHEAIDKCNTDAHNSSIKSCKTDTNNGILINENAIYCLGDIGQTRNFIKSSDTHSEDEEAAKLTKKLPQNENHFRCELIVGANSDEQLYVYEADQNNMGSNVSRHSGKGLSGRRTQSSGMYI